MIWGSFGSDSLYGGQGNDTLAGVEYAHGDIDYLYGSEGDDQLLTGEASAKAMAVFAMTGPPCISMFHLAAASGTGG